MTKGFALDDDRLKQGKTAFGKDYFRELLERVRSIRASERRIWQQITDIFAECSIDYIKDSEVAYHFYATIAESFDLISDCPAKRIYDAVRRIPRGKVATYGQIAEMAGDRKMARAVGNALHKNPDPTGIPCHRVVNAKGELAGEYAFGGEWKQAERLIEEGVAVGQGRVDIKVYQMTGP